jgi:hypothetical protein
MRLGRMTTWTIAVGALVLIGSFPTTSRADDGRGAGVSIGGKAGFGMPTSELPNTFIFAGELGYALPGMRERLGFDLGVALEVAFHQPRLEGSGTSDAVGGGYDYVITQRFLTLGLDAVATFSAGPVRPYGALGYGVYLLRTTNEAFGHVNVENQARAGMQVRGGAGYGIGPGELFGELRYHFVHLDFRSTGEASGAGIGVGLGYRLLF